MNIIVCRIATVVFIGLLFATPLGVVANDRIIRSQFIYEDASYPECHASTLVETAPGRLIAAWFGGTKERNPDVCIYVAHFQNGKWSKQTQVASGMLPDGSRLPTWNPVLFQPHQGPLVLFYKVGPTPRDWWGMMMTSIDGGHTWNEPQKLPNGILGPIKNKPIQLANGDWLCPSSTEANTELKPGANELQGGWQIHFERTRDAGKTWERIGPVSKGSAKFEAIQPSILIHSGEQLQALCRTKQGVIGQTWSTDGGNMWTPLTATELPNPNSGMDAVTLRDGRHLTVYNHSAHRIHEAKGNRYPLDVAVSNDGISWQRVATLETEPCESGYAYPAVIQAADGLVHITYTWNRRRIKHVILDPRKL
jgi:predicted neuraminidase